MPELPSAPDASIRIRRASTDASATASSLQVTHAPGQLAPYSNSTAQRQRIRSGDTPPATPGGEPPVFRHANRPESSITLPPTVLPLNLERRYFDGPAVHLGKELMQFAAKNGNFDEIRRLMQWGVDPKTIDQTELSQDARTFLDTAAKSYRLYPRDTLPHTGKPRPLSRLDIALKECRFEDATAEFEAAKQALTPAGKTTITRKALWQLAGKSNREDVRRAMLILYPEKATTALAKASPATGRSALHADMGGATMSAALTSYLKRYAYMSQRKERGALVNINRTTTFPGFPDMHIECRHMALHWIHLRQEYLLQKKQAALMGLPRPEFRYEHFQTAEDLKKNLPAGLDAESRHIVGCTRENHLINNSRLDQFLIRQFTEMAEKGIDARLMTLKSTNHDRALELQVNIRADGSREFVINFEDPNMSNNHFHVELDRLEEVCGLAMEAMMTKPEYVQPGGAYHFENFPISMVQIIEGDEPPVGTVPAPDRRCTVDDTIPLSGVVLYHWLACGFDGNLRDIENQLAEFEHEIPFDSALFELLCAYNKKKTPGIFVAAQEGRTAAVKTYCDLVLKSPLRENEQIALLKGMRPQDRSALAMGMQEGRVKTVQAYFRAILDSNLPEPGQEELLTATTHSGHSQHLISLSVGATEMAKLYCDEVLASGLSPAAKQRLIVAASDDGRTALQEGVLMKQTEAVRIQCEALSALPEITDEEKAKLIAGAGGDYYQWALQGGDFATAQVIKDAIDMLKISQKMKDALCVASTA